MDSTAIESALYIVATPIGNLQDITFRAVDILKQVDYIGAEDTRHSRLLLDHLGIDAKLFSLHDHNEQDKKEYIARTISQGGSIALISDAGTPLISDPGYHVVAYCRSVGIKVIPVPGPSAVITALSASGLPTDSFVFCGFLPVKEKALQDELSKLQEESRTCVYYESPRRILDTVRMISQVLGEDRRLVIGRELTKTFESFYDLPAGEMLDFLKKDENHTRGEFVLMIAGTARCAEVSPQVIKTLRMLMKELPVKKAATICGEIYGLRKNDLYRLALQESDSSRNNNDQEILGD